MLNSTNSNYVSGRRFEYRVKDFFLKQNAFVTRSGGSKFPDLVVIFSDGTACFVECKSHEKVPNNPIRLLSDEEYHGALELIRRYNSPFYLFYKINHHINAMAVGGKGLDKLIKLGLVRS